jgi:hypothetical protein
VYNEPFPQDGGSRHLKFITFLVCHFYFQVGINVTLTLLCH